MGSVTQPRGRLPKRVYWFRRGVLLAVALLMVFGIGKLLGGGTGEDPADTATTTSGSAAGAATTSAAPYGPATPTQLAGTRTGKGGKAGKTGAAVPLAAPSGPCAEDEVSVLPSVERAWAGAPITLTMELRGIQPACTFEVSPESLVVKITSGEDRIWSTQDCPKAIATQDVVVRSAVATTVPVTWSGRRSDADCSSAPAWALPGFYHVYAAAYGSTPADVQFEVTRAAPRTVTRTPKPEVTPSARTSATAGAKKGATSSSTARPSKGASKTATATPTAKPSRTP